MGENTTLWCVCHQKNCGVKYPRVKLFTHKGDQHTFGVSKKSQCLITTVFRDVFLVFTLLTISGFALCSSNSLTISVCPSLDANNKAQSPSYETTTINSNNK